MLGQVEQILDIFDIGEDRAEDDQLDFSQFHSKVCCTTENDQPSLSKVVLVQISMSTSTGSCLPEHKWG